MLFPELQKNQCIGNLLYHVGIQNSSFLLKSVVFCNATNIWRKKQVV